MTLAHALERNRLRQYIPEPEPEAQRLARESTSLNAQTQGRGLSVSWLRDRSALPESAYHLLTGEDAYKLGRQNAYHNCPNPDYGRDADYRRGWLQGLQDYNAAVKVGMRPFRDGDLSDAYRRGSYDHCGCSHDLL